jgi:Histidine kinase-like ATPase domain
MATGTPRPGTHHPPELLPGLRWRRVFPGHARELSALRRWLASLLPDSPARDDLLSVATELGSNAIQHTASGRGGWFAVEVTWHGPVIQVAVADCGGPDEPRVIDDPVSEHGRGLRLVRGLSASTGFTGDQHGRVVWAQIAWVGANPAHPPPEWPCQAVARAGGGARARRAALAASLAGA